MNRRQAPKPTDAELDILHALWRLGPSTVREVQDELNNARPTGYTTVLKLLQIMTEKGLVERDESQRAHVYRASYAEEQTQEQIVGELLDRVFDGSAAKLVMRALATKPASEDELQTIRDLLDEYERNAK